MTGECRKASKLDKGQEMSNLLKYVSSSLREPWPKPFMVTGTSPKSDRRIQTVRMPPCSEGQMTMLLYVIVNTERRSERHTETETDGKKQKQKETDRDKDRNRPKERKRTSVPLCPLSFCN